MNVKMTLRRNSPKLLTILAAMGTVSTAFATARATPKALLLIQDLYSGSATGFGYYYVHIWSSDVESKDSILYDQRIRFVGSGL